MYVVGNPKTKKQLKDWVKEGKEVTLFSAGVGSPQENGTEYVEGPQYPAMHSWYAKVQMSNGRVVKVA